MNLVVNTMLILNFEAQVKTFQFVWNLIFGRVYERFDLHQVCILNVKTFPLLIEEREGVNLGAREGGKSFK
jgi:hypothetical protein